MRGEVLRPDLGKTYSAISEEMHTPFEAMKCKEERSWYALKVDREKCYIISLLTNKIRAKLYCILLNFPSPSWEGSCLVEYSRFLFLQTFSFICIRSESGAAGSRLSVTQRSTSQRTAWVYDVAIKD